MLCYSADCNGVTPGITFHGSLMAFNYKKLFLSPELIAHKNAVRKSGIFRRFTTVLSCTMQLDEPHYCARLMPPPVVHQQALVLTQVPSILIGQRLTNFDWSGNCRQIFCRFNPCQLQRGGVFWSLISLRPGDLATFLKEDSDTWKMQPVFSLIFDGTKIVHTVHPQAPFLDTGETLQ